MTRGRIVAIVATAIVAALVFAGLFVAGSPWDQAESDRDRRRVRDLQAIVSAIDTFDRGLTLPGALTELNDGHGRAPVLVDPGGQPYDYVVKDARAYRLCARFDTADTYVDLPFPPDAKGWPHESGETCFDLALPPENIPPPRSTPAPSAR